MLFKSTARPAHNCFIYENFANILMIKLGEDNVIANT